MVAVSAQTHQVTLTSHSNPSFASTQDEVFFSLDTLFRPFDYIEITASAEKSTERGIVVQLQPNYFKASIAGTNRKVLSLVK
jgi:hypothetical protein